MGAMIAARFYAPNQPLKLEHVPIPEVGPEDILVEVKACGICGTDVHIVKGERVAGKTPIILGHESSGIIACVGEAISNWSEGDRVVINCVTSCGNCFNCLKGRDSICLNRTFTGIHSDGALAQYVRVKPRNLIALPKEISFEQGALSTDAVATPYHAIKNRANLQLAESIAIFGVGGIGTHAVKISKLAGAHPVVAVDISERALERAVASGADEIVNAQREDPVKAILEMTGEQGVDVALECVGQKQTVLWAAGSVRSGGRVVVVGQGPESVQLMDLTEFVRKEIVVMGSSASSSMEIKEILSLLTSRRLDLSSSITRTISLEQINEALTELSQNPDNFIRIVVTKF